MTDETYKRLLAARILSEANDLKRTAEAMAGELGYEPEALLALLSGTRPLEDLYDLIDRMERAYPIDGSDLHLLQDDCIAGVKLMRAEDSAQTSRTVERLDRSGRQTPYYEYRDTACSRLSPIRPEWIRVLRCVCDADPNNPDIVLNRGHFLHQYTLYIGPVNFYWTVHDQKFAREMNTGDSSYGTPWWPHTFANRDPQARALILAATFGGDVRRAQKELYVLGERTKQYVIDARQPRRAVAQLVRQYMACETLSDDGLASRLAARGSKLSVGAIFDETSPLSSRDIEELANCLDIDAVDLYVPAYQRSHEVVIKRSDPGAIEFYPDAEHPVYAVMSMARVSRMPLLRGVSIEPMQDEIVLRPPITHCLHSWVYNYGTAPARLWWTDGKSSHETILEVDDSAYLQPFIPHAYARVTPERVAICEVRVPGAMGLSAQRELSAFSEVERVYAERTRWF